MQLTNYSDYIMLLTNYSDYIMLLTNYSVLSYEERTEKTKEKHRENTTYSEYETSRSAIMIL